MKTGDAAAIGGGGQIEGSGSGLLSSGVEEEGYVTASIHKLSC